MLVDISSELAIPEETNNLVVRISVDGAESVEEVYTLGDAPRDRWPQTLPLLADDALPERLTVAGELRVTTEGRPSVVVGYGEVQVDFPNAGTERTPLEVPRACRDDDGDGYGLGFGCISFDCDDDDPDVPRERFCGEPAARDGGVRDGGGRDAGPPVRDGGVVGTPCGTMVCGEDEACLNRECYPRCMSNADCGELHLGCLTRYGVCICRVPCGSTNDCGPLECTDGCCRF